MASITIRNLEDSVKTRLRVQAAAHGRSMEEEARYILRDALDHQRPGNLADLACELFGAENGVDLEPHPAVYPPAPPEFGAE